MTRNKSPKASSSGNRPIFSRVSYLYQAATYLSRTQAVPCKALGQSDPAQASHREDGSNPAPGLVHGTAAATPPQDEPVAAHANNIGFSRRLLFHLLEVSLKSQTSLSPDLKRTICRRCHSLLLPGQSCRLRIENASRGGRKPWADVLVVECSVCMAVRRFPIGQERRPRRDRRISMDPTDEPGGTTQHQE